MGRQPRRAEREKGALEQSGSKGKVPKREKKGKGGWGKEIRNPPGPHKSCGPVASVREYGTPESRCPVPSDTRRQAPGIRRNSSSRLRIIPYLERIHLKNKERHAARHSCLPIVNVWARRRREAARGATKGRTRTQPIHRPRRNGQTPAQTEDQRPKEGPKDGSGEKKKDGRRRRGKRSKRRDQKGTSRGEPNFRINVTGTKGVRKDPKVLKRTREQQEINKRSTLEHH